MPALLLVVAGLVLIFATTYNTLGIALLVLGAILVVLPILFGLFAMRKVNQIFGDDFFDRR